ncbi:Hypothetical Protein FCC1311_039182 [Hondaea fermentalgiana]|uniref:Uncharacterized protein n=1 Tax=Hondaea fermentalgiana TaxID=2315210 RepID=A0A2R5GAS1_9STRA|nr:Hypothetical Protein FCC1311_039182 [Hondaea fermentalgiana]|eukprot:GBG27695.1 Hypothetical Protein FCC1311_039182 [Hondaea fermentalgiana]
MRGAGVRRGRRDAFCTAVTDLVKRRRHAVVETDDAWSQLLDEEVNHAFLRATLEHASQAQLLAPVAVFSAVRPMPLTHVLVRRLLESVQRKKDGGQVHNREDDAEELIRRKHALEMLAVLIGGIMSRHYVDFEEQALRMLCSMDDAETVFGRLLEEVSGIAEREDELANEALVVLLALTMACEHLQRNSLLDHFRVRHEAVAKGLGAVLARSERTMQHEAVFAEYGLLCHHRKHESRNMFAQHLRETSVNDTHRYLFSLRAVLADFNTQFVRSTTGTYARGDENDIFGWVDMASESVISWGGQLTSSLGAWITGLDVSAEANSKASKAAQQERARCSAESPILVQSPELKCDAALWARAQLMLLFLYEVCSMRISQGSNVWMRVLTEHDAPPWAAADGHSLPQPLRCADVFLETLTFLTFCLQANTSTPFSTHVALLVLRGLVENVQVSTLLFAVAFEDTSNVDNLHVFHRQKEMRLGSLAFVPAVKQQNRPQRGLSAAGTSNSSEAERHRRSLESMSMRVVEKSLAAVLYHQVAAVLLEFASDEKSTSLQGQSDAGQHHHHDHDHHQQQPQQSDPSPKSSSHTAAPRTGLHHEEAVRHGAGAVCARAVDLLHRLIMFEKRTFGTKAPHGAALLLGVDWVFVSRGLFCLLDRLANGPTTFAGFTAARYLDLCVHVVHMLNLILDSDLQDDRSRVLFFLEILRHRVVIEKLGAVLERDHSLASIGGPRVVQHDLANLRNILFHFSAVVMMLEESPEVEMTSAERSKRDQEILERLATAASTLRLAPHDRLRDGFQRYVETQHERALLRDFIVRVISDCNRQHVFEKKAFPSRASKQ